MAISAKLAIIQMSMANKLDLNIEKATKFIKEAVEQGANIVLLPELFENHYFI